MVIDHQSLSYLNEQNMHFDIQRKAMTRLMDLKFKIVYKPGKENHATDALSGVAHLYTLQTISVVQP